MSSFLRATIFGLAIFGSAALIFLVQPLVGKRILPWFGGAPAVWTLCLAFYQTTLFLGYAYADGMVRYASRRLQVVIHGAVLVLASLCLPVLPGESAKPAPGNAPESEILSALIGNVALPFLALAATGPLVQSWFAFRFPNRSPYFLYSISNAGSLLGLLGYSFFLEPTFSISSTGAAWSYAFVGCAFAIIAAGLLASAATQGSAPESVEVDATPTHPLGHTTHAKSVMLWASLSASAVILLTGLTNELTIDVASFPFLWVLMLAAYLASFILAFASERAYSRFVFLPLAGVLLLITYAHPYLGPIGPLIAKPTSTLSGQLVLYVLLLFSLATVLHGELYRLRPEAGRLTSFYLVVSAGGALGGLFAGIVAPRIFTGIFEVFVGLGLGWLALLGVWASPSQLSTSTHGARKGARLAGLAMGSVLVIGPQLAGALRTEGGQLMHQERTFFGVLKVFATYNDGTALKVLRNGITDHGYQAVGESQRRRPTSYFGVHTGIGLVLRSRSSGPPLDVGIVGLGAGTLAAYGRERDYFRFYEIDPAVTQIARDPRFFSFLSDSNARIDVVGGDARLALAAEDPSELFDVLILDAFSSDAIPIHLMTQEAIELYSKRLEPGGLLAFHISNRHFDLEPVVARLASTIGFDTLVIESVQMPKFLSGYAKWTILSPDAGELDRLEAFSTRVLRQRKVSPRAVAFRRYSAADPPGTRTWTDDYSDPLGALR